MQPQLDLQRAVRETRDLADVVEMIREHYHKDGGGFAGIPVPLPYHSLTIHPAYPFAKVLSEAVDPWPEYKEAKTPEDDEDDEEEDDLPYARVPSPIARTLNTLDVAAAWSFHAEMRALKKLRRHLWPEQFQDYVLTGAFVESSGQSKVQYLFRRLRPTVAISCFRNERKGTGRDGRFLAALCLHPIGYYDGTHGGAMVPTDDVLAHYLLLQADEAYFWRVSNQHSLKSQDLWM